jgi:hypothetical protein
MHSEMQKLSMAARANRCADEIKASWERGRCSLLIVQSKEALPHMIDQIVGQGGTSFFQLAETAEGC